MIYRRDIDGLRAVAVLPVILSHAGLPYFSGGFVGVDVFFVISGYLITGILLGEMQAGTYSLRRFYERRARRIMPALLLVILVTLPVATFLMLPEFRQNFGQSVVATLLFANNILLAITSGYWDLESGFKPLLHTWSLGVEEQFYILFPLLLAATWRFGQRWQLGAIAIIGAVSFGLAEHGWRTSPAVSFYLPTTRAWELMVGCAVAFVQKRERPWDGLLSALGLAAIVASVVVYGEGIPSPSAYMVLPVSGAAAVIVFSRPGLVAYRVLSTRLLVGIGLVSYSAYLWHQPLIALARVASLQPPPQWVMIALALASLGLAWVSWRLVEIPFRSRARVSSAAVAWSVGGVSALLLAAGLMLHFGKGFPERVFPNLEAASDIDGSYNERIRAYSSGQFACRSGKRVLVIGNSVARDAANVLLEAGAVNGTCIVYLALEPATVASGDGLARYGSLLESADVLAFAVHHGDDVEGYVGAIRRISSRTAARVAVFGPKYFGWNLNPFGLVPVRDRPAARSRVPDDVLRKNQLLRTLLGAGYVDVLALLSDDGRQIRVFDDLGNPLSPDRFHLTRYGARLLAERLAASRPDTLALFAPASGQ
jgi:peptidoglycan/LPS O-acetylase OafA/YrhL